MKNIYKFSAYHHDFLGNVYLFKANNGNSRKMYEICSKLTIKAPGRRHCRHSVPFIVNFKHISHLFLWASFCLLGFFLRDSKNSNIKKLCFNFFTLYIGEKKNFLLNDSMANGSTINALKRTYFQRHI